jgi:acyl-CoA thioesterase-1
MTFGMLMALATVFAEACKKAEPAKDAAAENAAASSYEAGSSPVPSNGATTSTPSGNANATAAGKRTVVFIGTSLTAGLGLDPKDAYPALVGAKADSSGLAVEVVNAGLSGETSAGALRRVQWLLTAPADVILLETGANDGLRGLDVDTTRANIDHILGEIQKTKPQATLLLMQMEAPPNMGKVYTAAFHRMYGELAKAHGVPLVPFLLAGVAGDTKLNQPDGIHPNETGSRIVAANVFKAVEPVLRQKQERTPTR